jgi:hypothetical protein
MGSAACGTFTAAEDGVLNTNLVGIARAEAETRRPAMLPDSLSAPPRLQHSVHQRLGHANSRAPATAQRQPLLRYDEH